MADYDSAIRIDPGNNALAYRSRGQAFEAKGKYRSGSGRLRRGNPDRPKGRHGAFHARVRIEPQGAIDDSIAGYDEVIRINPADATAYSNRGILWSKKGDIDRAIADFNEAVRLDPGYTGALARRGLAYERKQDIERARSDFMKVLSLRPNIPAANGARDTAQVRLGVLTPAAAPAATTGLRLKSVEPPAAPAASRPTIVAPPVRSRQARSSHRQRRLSQRTAATEPGERCSRHCKGIAGHRFSRHRGNRPGSHRHGTGGCSISSKRHLPPMFGCCSTAGHGIQVDGNNYLVPIDAAVKSKNTAIFELVDIDRILKGLDDEAHANVVILDACRDNPFETRIAPSRSAGRGAGLSGYEAVGAGTLIAFATAPGTPRQTAPALTAPHRRPAQAHRTPKARR